jgi:3'-phosphoadenosine 5'-phosphosulfate (PAPS) 3'-phosphatase
LGYWDVCAGHALCKEVGGGLFYFNGDELLYKKGETLINGKIYMSPNRKKIDQFAYKLKGITLNN